MLSVVMMNVIMLNVVAPNHDHQHIIRVMSYLKVYEYDLKKKAYFTVIIYTMM